MYEYVFVRFYFLNIFFFFFAQLSATYYPIVLAISHAVLGDYPAAKNIVTAVYIDVIYASLYSAPCNDSCDATILHTYIIYVCTHIS